MKLGIFTPSGYITSHPNEQTRFTIHRQVPATAGAFGVPTPASAEPLHPPKTGIVPIRKSALAGFS